MPGIMIRFGVSDAKFTHGICRDYSKELYGNLYKKASDNLSKKNI